MTDDNKNPAAQNFKMALDKAGLSTKEPVISDGKLQRFHVSGDRQGSKNGWYVLFGDGVPAGSFGSWKTGKTHKWCAKDYKTLSVSEKREQTLRYKAAVKLKETKQKKEQGEAAEKAATVLKKAKPADASHCYLQRKKVGAYGELFLGANDCLILPLRDAEGVLHSLQYIDVFGRKRFLKSGKIKGCFFLIGEPNGRILICEGYATGATLHEETGYPVAVAFNAGNLLPVCHALSDRYVSHELIICADNDTNTLGNPGITKATEAAKAVGAKVIIPPVSGDFNDFFRENS